jgi:hypothetical protein
MTQPNAKPFVVQPILPKSLLAATYGEQMPAAKNIQHAAGVAAAHNFPIALMEGRAYIAIPRKVFSAPFADYTAACIEALRLVTEHRLEVAVLKIGKNDKARLVLQIGPGNVPRFLQSLSKGKVQQ